MSTTQNGFIPGTGGNPQPLDSDLTQIAAIVGSEDDLIQYKSGSWVGRTVAQIKTSLGLTKSDVGLSNVDNTSDATKNAASATLTNKTLTSPVINTPTGIVKGDVGLGNVDNTSNATERAATRTLTNARITKRVSAVSGPGATPTFNTDTYDVLRLTALATAITSMTTNLSGTPVDGDLRLISFTDNGTARAITWGSSFESSGNVTLPTTTAVSARLDVVVEWNAATSKWRCVGVA